MSDHSTGGNIASAYDRWSRSYESCDNATRDLAAAVLRRHPLELRGRDVIEVGCGTGLNTGFLAEQSRTVLAIDFSPGMLEQARTRVSAKNVRFVQHDLQQEWPVADGSLDLVVCMLVLEHIEDLSHVFNECFRVLRAGGEFFFSELHPFRQLRGGQAQFRESGSDSAIFVPAFMHSVSEFVNGGVDAGFEVVHIDETRNEKDAAAQAPPRLFTLHLRKPVQI
jgi:ubiquinone/menaquinone biosynthesis C-methylase UbiE